MNGRKDDVKTRLLATFREEADDHLKTIMKNLLDLERGLSSDKAGPLIEGTFREMHTLKGAARSVGLSEIERLCQACESVLSKMTRGSVPLTRPLLDGLHQSVKSVPLLMTDSHGSVEVRDLIARLEGAASARGTGTPRPSRETARIPPEAPPPPAPPGAESLRVGTAGLDAVLLQAEELLVPKVASSERAREAGELAELLSACRGELRGHGPVRPPASGGQGSPARRVSGLDTALRAAEQRARDLAVSLQRDHRGLAATVDALQSQARALRLSPASTVLDLFPGMIRDLAGEQEKEIECAVRGGALDVDRKILEVIKDPLIHAVRNAADHGIESPAERAAAGKPRRGRIGISVEPLEGGRLEIRVEDDGRGIDPKRVKAAAVRSRLLAAEETEALSDEAAIDLVYRAGLSTSPMITAVSGHGLGLTIIRETVERLGGQIRLETRAGAGTCLKMALAATVASSRGLLVRSAGRLFLLPGEAVERVVRVPETDVRQVEGRETIAWAKRALPLARLSDLMGMREERLPDHAGERRACVIVASGDERMALGVDEIVGEREVLVKDFTPPLVRLRHLAGAGLLGTGEMALILRAADLLRATRQAARPRAPAGGPEPKKKQGRILVVDDSITTRTMEKNLLEAAGYRTQVAVDGMEAWSALKTETFDLVITDVDMPRMDGFELTRSIRGDRRLADLPVILVTALESREDKERGIDVGANAYVVKSSFDQSNLLEIIRRLV